MAAATAAETSASRGSVVAAIATGNRGGITTRPGSGPDARNSGPTVSIDSGSGVATGDVLRSPPRQRASRSGSMVSSSASTRSTASACLHTPNVSASGQLHVAISSERSGISPSRPSSIGAGAA